MQKILISVGLNMRDFSILTKLGFILCEAKMTVLTFDLLKKNYISVNIFSSGKNTKYLYKKGTTTN